MEISDIILLVVGLLAGFLSGAVGFGGGMILLPVVTSFYGVTVAVPVCTIAQLLSNITKVGLGFKQINWKQAGFFLITAAPLTALGAFGFASVPKVLLTRILCIFLIVFAIMKLAGKMNLPKKKGTMLIGGGITGLVNGFLGISGPLSSAVFLTLGLAPVAYISTEATAAMTMHLIKILMYGKLNLVDGPILVKGLCIGAAMMVGNFIGLKIIRNARSKTYQKVVAAVMICASIWLFISVK